MKVTLTQPLFSAHRPHQRKAIVGGKTTAEGRYPYVVTLKKRRKKHQCGGTLIAPNMVLTAAHCFGIRTVVIGDHNITDTSGVEEAFKVRKRIRHPQYNRTTKEFDAMILVLNGRSSHPTVKLNSDSDYPAVSESTTAIGWGATAKNGTQKAEELQEVSLTLMSNTKCDEKYHLNITDAIMCTTDKDGAFDSDACKGDSGGPLIIKRENAAEDIQVGIVSFGGKTCATSYMPGGFTRISAIHDWIHKVMCDGPFACRTFEAPLQLKVTFNFDQFSNEIRWNMVKLPKKIIEEKGFNSYPVSFFAYGEATEIVNIEEEGSYEFSIRDRQADGMCCAYGNGSYTLSLSQKNDPNKPIVSFTTKKLRKRDVYGIKVTSS